MTRVLYVAYPLLTVSCEAAGGAEQVLWTLEREVTGRGVLTTVAASAGSQVSGELFATGESCTHPDDYDRRRAEHEGRVMEFIRQREREGKAFDLVHDMSGSFWRRAAEIGLPVLATLHLPRSFYSPESFENIPANVSFNCVSQSQARSFSDLANMIGVAPNGIAQEKFAADSGGDAQQNSTDRSDRNRQGLIWLGRICEEKAPHLALEIAERAGFPVTIAGQVYPFSYHQQYFEREVAPRLKAVPNARFIASPSFEAKRSLLREAQALLITSLAEETSSLVGMEAAASGTPVVAFRRGALPEVVRDGVTGFVVDDVSGAVEACSRLESISNAACRAHAEENFSSTRMADGYTQLYARILQAGTQMAIGA
ncbi:MAG TPA: glycosyltransferase [Candidatus Angelobacter sp.]|jgi:glycosyltransferase involved in cell wall biosynthesis